MRPTVTLKLATSLDGRIATASGESKWITGEAARLEGHRLRASHDAILVGVETVLADDPELTARFPISAHPREGGDPVLSSQIPAFEDEQASERPADRHPRNWIPAFAGMGGEVKRQPLRIVLDSRLRTPSSAKVAAGNTLILTAVEPRPIGAAEVQRIETMEGRPAPDAVLASLVEHGVASVLIEGGGQVAASFLRAGLVDRMEWFRAPILLGGEGRSCVAALALANLARAPKFRRLSAEPVGDDLWERYEAIR